MNTRIALIGAACVAALAVVGCASVEEPATVTKAKPAKPKAEANSAPKSKRAQVVDGVDGLDAGGFAGELKLLDSEVSKDLTQLYIQTPEGGLEGASTDDLDAAAAAVFRKVFDDVGYSTDQLMVIFRGGLVDTRTGQDLPDEETGSYTMTRSQASKINFDDEDAIYIIHWSLYRDFVHPAIKSKA